MFSQHLRYAVWFDPEPTVAEYLTTVMTDLRERYGGPAFAPHATVTSGLQGSPEDLTRGLSALAAGCPRFVANPQPVQLSGAYYTAMMIPFDAPAAAADLRRGLRQAGDLDPEDPWRPHVSLLYTTLSPDQAQELMTEWAAQVWPPIRFDSCSLWRLEGTTEQWQRVALVPLAEA